jgi:hypothetical protein
MKKGVLLFSLFQFVLLLPVWAGPPVVRSTYYSGTGADVQSYPQNASITNVVMTIEAWVYREDASRCETIVSHNFQSSFWFGFCNRLRFYRSGGISVTSSRDVPARQWTHVAVSYDGTRARFYINGQLTDDLPLAHAGPGASNPLHIGGNPESAGGAFGNGYYFRGYMDEVRLWSTARTQSEIQSNMFVEIATSETNAAPAFLSASFSRGGGSYRMPFWDWTATTSLDPSRLRGFGILPNHLVVPRAATFNFDGFPDTNFEFAGSETAVLRYHDGANWADAPIHLVHRNSGTNRYLYIGVDGLRASIGRTWEESHFAVHVDPNGSRDAVRQAGDFNVSVTTGAGSGSGLILPLTIYQQHGSNWEYRANFCRGEFVPPCLELRVHASDFGNFTNEIGLLLRHGPNTNISDFAVWPGDGNLSSPATYSRVMWGGDADADLSRVTASGRALDVFTGEPIANQPVYLYSGENSLSGTFVAQTTTSASGQFAFSNLPVLESERVTLRIVPNVGYSAVEPRFGVASGSAPVRTNNAAEVVYAPCASTCTLQSIDFMLSPPPGPMRLDGFSPTTGVRSVTVRTSPPRVQQGSIIRISGSNIHSSIQVYFSKCTVSPPDFCTEGSTIFEAPVVAVDPMRRFVDVRVPEVTAPLPDTYAIVIRDNWSSHPGWTQWNYITGGTRIVVADQPYPLLYGFDWPNDGDGPSHQDFEAAYGQNVFTYVPVPPFKVRDPYYFAFWFPLYFAIGSGTDGNCFGLAGVSRMFERGILNEADFESAADGGPAGVRFPNGFRGRNVATSSGVEFQPWKPATWTGFDVFEPYRPLNLWAVVRAHMMSQFSEEGIQNILSQAPAGIGSPNAALTRLRSNVTGYTLCFQPTLDVKGHCVTPYAVRDGWRLAADDFAITNDAAAANFSIISVYDNNWPNVERFLEVNRSANRYRYLLGSRDGEKVIWSGRSLYTFPLSFYTSGKHAPGPWNLAIPDRIFRLILAAGADGLHTNQLGQMWGWDAAGAFQTNYPGVQSYFPFTSPNFTNRSTRTAFAFFSESNRPSGTLINVRSNSYLFHAAQSNLAVQVITSNSVPGTRDQAQLVVQGGALGGFRFRPQATVQTTPMLAQPSAGGGHMVFTLAGLNLPAANEIEVFSTGIIGEKLVTGLGLFNNGGAPLTYSLKLGAASSNAFHDKQYGPFTTPAGAALCLTFPNWPDASVVRVETDLGHNGTVDAVEDVAADYLIFAQRDGAELVLQWRSPTTNDMVQYRENLGPGSKWSSLNGTPQVNGAWKTLRVPAAAAERYYRIAR